MSSRIPESFPDPEVLREWVSTILGAGVRVEDNSRDVGRRTFTWQLTVADGTGFYLKRHEHAQHFRSECLFLTEWIPKMAAAAWWTAPRLVSSNDDLGAVIFTALAGDLAADTELLPPDGVELYRLAGRWVAILHALEVDVSAMGASRRYDATMVEESCEAASLHFDAQVLTWVRALCTEKEAFDGPMVPTHGDYSPRNWLVDRRDGQIRLGVFDFERARATYWMEDCQRMAVDYWRQDSRLREAFFEGYGRVPTAKETRQMDLISLINAVNGVTWATKYDDLDFSRFCHRTVERIRGAMER